MESIRIGVLGLTNAGKSTLVNQLHKANNLLVSPMNNTTLLAVSTNTITHEKQNITFIDVPGFSEKRHSSYELISQEIRKALSGIDVLLLVVRSDQQQKLPLLQTQLQPLKRYRDLTRVLLINNFFDVVLQAEDKQAIVLDFKPQAVLETDLLHFDATSFWNQFNEVKLQANEFRKDVEFLDADTDNFKILEALREQIIKYCNEEIPHVVRLEIVDKSFDQTKNLLKLHLSISVPKLSQKKIIIGRNAQMVKKIGMQMRQKLLEYYDCNVFVELFVRTYDPKQKKSPYGSLI
ncbi:GTPase Era [Mycoplasmoides pneumoniae]|uniref:GTPase Era n=1 Tax=Mycoplasmoides pneumoniae TaxID=2104 RepID=UPI0013311395|nr:GTPase Era [Mycoplasmoides pneumoniae]